MSSLSDKISDKDLAVKLNVTVTTFSNWKKSRQKLLSIIKLGLKTEEKIEETKNYLDTFKNSLEYSDLNTYIKTEEKELTNTDIGRLVETDPKTIKNWRTDKPYLIKLIYFGIATEKYIKNTEEYLEEITKY